jgi:hypothetical protein
MPSSDPLKLPSLQVQENKYTSNLHRDTSNHNQHQIRDEFVCIQSIAR